MVAKLKAEGPTAEEIQRATAGLELGFVSGLQSNLGKSFTLADGAGFHNDPGYFQTEYQKLLAVTPADVKRVANKYLTPGRVVLSIVPMGKLDQASKPDESKKVGGVDGDADDRTLRPCSRSPIALALVGHRAARAAGARSHEDAAAGQAAGARTCPAWTKATLANGAELIVSEKHDLPLVSFTITFLGGANQFEPAGRQGLAGADRRR